jgi:hypothetical protein
MTEDTRSNSDSHNADNQPAQRPWQGIAEIDQAILENRLTEYRWKKAWADPWARVGMMVVITVLTAFLAFVVVSELVF